MKVREAMTVTQPDAATTLLGRLHAVPDQDVAEVVVMMSRYRAPSLPVVDAHRVVGMISLRGVSQAIVRADSRVPFAS